MTRSTIKRPTVALLLRIVPHYRVEFLRQLAPRLDRAGIDLRVLYGQERPGTQPPTVSLDHGWARRVQNFYAQIGALELVWQHGVVELPPSSLVIVEQASRLLANYVLQLRRRRNGFKLGYWGHGRNLQNRNTDSLSERLKRRLVREVDWWFAYTQLSADHVHDAGFAAERITVVNNTVDDRPLALAARGYEGMTRRELAREIGCRGDNIALFCGSLYADKRLDFVLDAARRIRMHVPDFELVVVGGGPERGRVEQAARGHDWIHYAGVDTSPLRARYFQAAKVLLMPALVGLVIVDSFICGCPLVTTHSPHHGPEIAYLQRGCNGVIAPNEPSQYADAVAALLRDDMQLAALRQGCLLSAPEYSLPAMVERFANGVEQCLNRPSAIAVRPRQVRRDPWSDGLNQTR